MVASRPHIYGLVHPRDRGIKLIDDTEKRADSSSWVLADIFDEEGQTYHDQLICRRLNIDFERSGDLRESLQRNPWTLIDLHHVQLALYRRQGSVGYNYSSHPYYSGDHSEEGYYTSSSRGYSGRPFLGGFFVALGAPFVAFAFYLIDKPRNQRNDWWLFWCGNGIAALLIAQGVTLIIFGTWTP